MADSMHNRKMTKRISLPSVQMPDTMEKRTLPFNGKAVSEKSYSFSFACFDRSHELFNLGDNSHDGIVSGRWFLDLLDCLKSVSNMNAPDLSKSMHDLHPIDWRKTNTSVPKGGEQCDYWQFRINKSKGRVIGIIIDRTFYVVWLDPHHNLTNSEGYGTATYYKAGLSLYEIIEQENENLKIENQKLKEDLKVAEELMCEFSIPSTSPKESKDV